MYITKEKEKRTLGSKISFINSAWIRVTREAHTRGKVSLFWSHFHVWSLLEEEQTQLNFLSSHSLLNHSLLPSPCHWFWSRSPGPSKLLSPMGISPSSSYLTNSGAYCLWSLSPSWKLPSLASRALCTLGFLPASQGMASQAPHPLAPDHWHAPDSIPEPLPLSTLTSLMSSSIV